MVLASTRDYTPIQDLAQLADKIIEMVIRMQYLNTTIWAWIVAVGLVLASTQDYTPIEDLVQLAGKIIEVAIRMQYLNTTTWAWTVTKSSGLSHQNYKFFKTTAPQQFQYELSLTIFLSFSSSQGLGRFSVTMYHH